jgi:hypothetical protein
VRNNLKLGDVERAVPVSMIEAGLNYKMTNESNPTRRAIALEKL